LRRLPRALEKNFPGKVKYKCFSTKEEVNRLFSDAESIARKTYQRGLNVGFLNDVETKRRILLAAQKSQLIAYLIYIDNEPCAFWIGIIYGHILHLDFTGYDPSFKRYQVGTIGFAKMIDHVRSNYRYVTQIDFGFGSSTFKEHFGTESHNEVSLYAFAPTLRNFYVNAARSIVIGSGKSLISVLKKMRLEGMVKKRWRARLQKTQAV
jgi:CelD/BcsL family acetyltransferase involved in cellulose biosynthesis